MKNRPKSPENRDEAIFAARLDRDFDAFCRNSGKRPNQQHAERSGPRFLAGILSHVPAPQSQRETRRRLREVKRKLLAARRQITRYGVAPDRLILDRKV